MRATKWALIVLLLALTPVMQAELLTNGDFETAVTIEEPAALDETVTPGQWYGKNATYSPTDGNPEGHVWMQNGNQPEKARVLAQVLHDESATSGVVTLSFDYATMVQETDTNAKTLEYTIYAYDEGGSGMFDFEAIDVKGSDALPTPADATVIGDSEEIIDLGTTALSWTTETQDFDLGSTGYNYLVVYFEVMGFDNEYTSQLQLDNVSLTPEPATMSLLGLGGLVALRRRRK